MKKSEESQLLALLPNVCAFYRQDFSEFLGNVWLAAMAPYSFAEVKGALERHSVNPDTGMFMPKPADVVRMLGGTSLDVALAAWSKVAWAIRCIGHYSSVVFDDPLTHKVIEDMGGWVKINDYQSAEKLEFGAKEFQTRYRGFAMRSERPPYQGHLVGQIEAQHGAAGLAYDVPPRAIGEPSRCLAVLKGGVDTGPRPVALLVSAVALPQLPGPAA